MNKVISAATVKAVKGKRLIPARAALTLVSNENLPDFFQDIDSCRKILFSLRRNRPLIRLRGC